MVNDPVGDFIIRLKNASAVRAEFVSLPYSKFKFAVASKLAQRGYVKSVAKRGKKIRKTLEVELAYGKGGQPTISEVKRISKPGRRLYRNVSEIYPVRYGKGLLLLSTPKGVLTGDEAKKEKTGGEALFDIW